MIRLIVALIFTFFAVLFCLPTHLSLKAAIKKNHIEGWTKAWKFVKKFFKALIFLSGTKVEVRGLEHLSEDKPYLYVANHRSYFDVIILQTITPGPVGFVAKKEFKRVPLLHHYMTDIGCLFLDRENPREGLKTISEATDHLKEGLSMSLFPEGRRNHDAELLPFKSGGYRMAEKSESGIVVTAMTGMDDIFENNKPLALRKKHVIIEFAQPVYPHEMDKAARKDFYDSIPERIVDMQKNHQV
ncbi:MAG: 1-acyl-sn-glycerol-3-phosphate acyltransferase [Eubacterium sp.]|nr:1-acyl-sn-glycerol-3-phosphate acyltransferase [Eubacterium sp.]